MNSDSSMPSQDDFQAALMSDLGVPPASDEGTPPAPTPGEAEGAGGEATPPAAGAEVTPPEGEQPKGNEPPKPQGGEAEKPKEAEATDIPKETPEEKANREAQEAANKEEPKPLTIDDVKKAMAENQSESQARIDQVHSAREEIIGKLYPEGIDRNIYDTDGKVIKTAQDIVDRGLINERTGEAFTYEEAASFMLEANAKMAEQVDKLNSWAEDVAEKNISLVEGNARVMQQHGEVLKAMPNLAKQLAEEYITTQLKFDKTGSYITEMAMSPERFYGLVMPAYHKLAEAIAEKNTLTAQQQADAAEEEKRQKETEQNERNGLPPQRGQSAQKANTGDPMLDALIDELDKG